MKRVVVQIRGGILEPIYIDKDIELEIIDHDDELIYVHKSDPETGKIVISEEKGYNLYY